MGSTRQMLRRAATLVVALVLVTAVAVDTPASAVVPLPGEPAFEGNYRLLTTQVGGTYVPVPLECSVDPTQPSASILWYAPGPAQDHLWRAMEVEGDRVRATSTPLSIGGDYRPFTGDFDGNGCDDVFWYAPGPAADFVWYGSPEGRFASVPVKVNGTYRPVVGQFDGDPADDVLWHGPGAIPESIWRGSPSRRFTASIAPQVTGSYQPTRVGEVILWYAPGAVTDFVTIVRAGRTRPDYSARVQLDLVADAVSLGDRTLLHRAGAGSPADRVLHRTFREGGLQRFDHWEHELGGTYRIGSSRDGGLTVLHAPGAATDRIMISVPDLRT